MDDLNDFTSAMTELGIENTNLDESDIESEDLVTEESQETEEAQENDGELDDEESLDPETTSEEALETEEVPQAKDEAEEPKMTRKEFLEIETAKASLEAKETAFNERIASQEKELQEKFHDKVKTHDEFDSFLANLAEKDPELFEILATEFKAHRSQYSNPVQEQTRQEISELRKELASFKEKASTEVTLTKLDSELKQAKETFGKEAEDAGLKIDWGKIEDAWAENPKMSLKNAFFAEYGESMIKASVSKTKVEVAKKKALAVPITPTAGTMRQSNASESKNFSGMSTLDVLKHEARKMTGQKL